MFVDAREFVLGRRTGIGRYLEGLLVGLRGKVDIILAGNPAATPRSLARLSVVALKKESGVWLDHYELGQMAKKVGADFFFSPYYKVPVFCGLPMIDTVHDLTDWRIKGFGSSGRRLAARIGWKMSLQRVRRILVDSQYTAEDLKRFAPSVAEKVRVVYPDLSEAWYQEALAHVDEVEREKSLLYVGNFKPHKNVDLLVRAVAELKAAGCWSGWLLRLVGGGGQDLLRVRDLVASLDLRREVEVFGQLPEEELVTCYKTSRWLVTLSVYEGFGYPAVEAMACGCPVIFHAASSLPEVIGDGGVPVNGLWLERVVEVLRDAMLGRHKVWLDLAWRAKRQAQKFKPGTTARDFLAVVEQVL